MPAKERKSNSGKKKWLLNLFVYAVLIIVGYQIFVLVFGAGALSFTGMNLGNIPFLNTFGSFSLHSGVNGVSNGVGKVSGLPLTTDGYNKLLEYDQTIQLTADQKNQYAGYDVFIPCCGFKLTTTDENQDCRCGHHIALAGLIKYGITHGASRTDVQAEINAWKPVFFPVCTQQPGLCDLNANNGQ